MAIRSVCAFLVALLGFGASPVFAGLIASADITSTPNGSNYDYTVILHNTGTTTIGTFWLAWVPSGYDFMATSPLSVTAPVGWYGYVTNLGAGDGYGIEYYSYSSLYNLQAGQSLSSFAFESADTPASLAGSSVFYAGTPTATSVVYSQGPFSDAGYQFVATVDSAAVPEPSPLVLIATFVAVVLGGSYMRRKRPLVAQNLTQ